LISAAFERVPGLLGVCLYHLPGASPTLAALRASGLEVVDEGELAAPAIDLLGDACRERPAAEKKSLVRHERALRREGELVVRHLTRADEVLPRLDAFFAEHERRWRETEFPSLFGEPRQREFYRRLAAAGEAGGWLRFTIVEWNGRPIAHHFGMSHAGRYLWYKPSFAIEEARRSPGEVLLRSLLLAAADEGAACFDLGLGDEPFKERFATHVDQVRTIGIYPR
jgi:CelD/BcsL family acetyltransferase involved in cellulose biosynthesis